MVKMKESTKDDATLCANGEMTYPKGFGVLPVTVCNKKGETVIDVTLSNVAFIPNTPFNLVSVGDKVRAGWTVTFGRDKASLVNGDVVIDFDIVIDTPKGRLFAVRFKRPKTETSLIQASQSPIG